MKLMKEYTLQHLKTNKRHSISIIIAITIASALLCSLSIFAHTLWSSKVTSTIEGNGYWHGELWEDISGDKLKYVTENPEVESTMIKGSWITAKFADTERPYLLMRNADENFWSDMSLKNEITRGTAPKKSGDIILSKLFFLDNPSYEIGDTFTIPIGNRTIDGEIVPTRGIEQSGETFAPLEEKTYTIVGELDMSVVSAYPGYIAMGYLDHSDILPEDNLTVYMRFFNPRKIYGVLPQIAESTGLSKNEYGEYGIRYNTPLLSLYGIHDKNNSNIELLVIMAIAIIMVLLVMGAFILIIYNSFSLSANSRIKQLGILKSLGATPRQIKHSVIFEGFVLWVIQLPIGIFIGYLFSNLVVSNVNTILSSTEDYRNIVVSSSLWVVILAILVSLITVLISAYIPAKKVAKLSPIDGISENRKNTKIKKAKSNPITSKIFGIEGDLASAQFSSNKKSLRTAILSLSICFILVIGYINIISIFNLANSKNDELSPYNMSLNLNIVYEPDEKMIKEIDSIPEIEDSLIRRGVRTAIYVKEDQESKAFKESGGFSEISLKYNVLKEDDDYRIISNLVGLSDESFNDYCKKIGANPDNYYTQESITGILFDKTYHRPPSSKTVLELPILDKTKVSSLVLHEKVENNMNSDYTFNVNINDVTDINPGNIRIHRYSVCVIVPMSVYNKITENFQPERITEYSFMTIDFKVADSNSPNLKEELTDISNSYLGSQDYNIWSLLEEKYNDELVQKAMAIGVFAVALMIGLIGVFNTFSTVSNNIRLRKREFAVLRSVGLTPKGVNKILFLEGFIFALTPILISIPIILIICWYMLWITLITWSEFLSVFPYIQVLIYSTIVILSIFLSYLFSSNTLKNCNVVDSLKNEVV